MTVRSSRVDQPPVSGVPVAGATEDAALIHRSVLWEIKGRGKGERWGHTSRIQGVDVDAEVDGLLGPDALADLLDDARGADCVDLAGLDDLEAAVAVVFVVRGPGQRCADPGVDVGVVGEQAFLRRVEKVRAVVDGGLLRGRAAEDFGLPGVAGGGEKEGVSWEFGELRFRNEKRGLQVAVKVDHAHGTIFSVYAAQ